MLARELDVSRLSWSKKETLVRKSLRTTRSMLWSFEPSTLSPGTGLLSVPRVRTKHREAAFSFYAAHLWNKPPESSRSAATLTCFKSSLKASLFSDLEVWIKISYCTLTLFYLYLVFFFYFQLSSSWLYLTVFVFLSVCNLKCPLILFMFFVKHTELPCCWNVLQNIKCLVLHKTHIIHLEIHSNIL